MKDVMDFEVWWLLMVDTTWGMKSHVDKILVSRKQVLLRFVPKITGVIVKTKVFVSY
jgi:hypothetical protein